ncbi:hypothetical protein E2562_023061 [Oryza meyeriana var. granulata]|uniref:Uncharacterized protein n=1 Tax=Oryza meyeriana var. granulata TaxID=110450 RepID=A0A6G1ENX7_9ORYZ|nr:hypothetical protein E2562_023061 [Oryza meyeriana var. granulata]
MVKKQKGDREQEETLNRSRSRSLDEAYDRKQQLRDGEWWVSIDRKQRCGGGEEEGPLFMARGGLVGKESIPCPGSAKMLPPAHQTELSGVDVEPGVTEESEEVGWLSASPRATSRLSVEREVQRPANPVELELELAHPSVARKAASGWRAPIELELARLERKVEREGKAKREPEPEAGTGGAVMDVSTGPIGILGEVAPQLLLALFAFPSQLHQRVHPNGSRCHRHC